MPDHPVEQGAAGSTLTPPLLSPPLSSRNNADQVIAPHRPHRQDRKRIVRLDRLFAREPCRYPGSQLKGACYS